MKLAHYYHCYIAPGWEYRVDEHLEAVKSSGLIDHIDAVRIGVVGSVHERRHLVEFCSERVPIEVVAEAKYGWEQLTLQNMTFDWDFVLYAHTKTDDRWRSNMIDSVVKDWRQCIELIEDHEAVGCYWMTSESDPGRHIPVFGGNFWWAKASLIQRLPPLRTETRWDAEGWIGSGEPVDIVNLIPGQEPRLTCTPRELWP